jgi:hypothetical protein
LRDHNPTRWVICFYPILARPARPIYVTSLLLFV